MKSSCSGLKEQKKLIFIITILWRCFHHRFTSSEDDDDDFRGFLESFDSDGNGYGWAKMQIVQQYWVVVDDKLLKYQLRVVLQSAKLNPKKLWYSLLCTICVICQLDYANANSKAKS